MIRVLIALGLFWSGSAAAQCAGEWRVPRGKAMELAVAAYDRENGRLRRPIEVQPQQQCGPGDIESRGADPLRWKKYKQALDGKRLWYVEVFVLDEIAPSVYERILARHYYIDATSGEVILFQNFTR